MKKILLLSLVIIFGIALLPYAGDSDELKITWFGHACFLITTPDKTTILTDPIDYEEYKIPEEVIPSVVTVSHNHFDHNQVGAVSGEPKLIYGLTREEIGPEQKFIPVDDTLNDVRIYNVKSNHFKPEESPVLNAIFVYEFSGVRIAHLGDLGRTLTEEQIDKIGKIDILMIPVGGKYTVELAEADTLVAQLNPTMAVVPMHFRTRVADFVPNTADDFVKNKSNIVRVPGNEYIFNLKEKPDSIQYVVFDCFK
jgi:L-ascorbate metabolism protein UlaG (beta-lactamase superfamily)